MSTQSYLSLYAKSFNWAGFFLPKQTYLKCSVLYDFCRVADNIADSNDPINKKKIKFLKFQNNFNNKKFDDPKLTVPIEDKEYEQFLKLSEKMV